MANLWLEGFESDPLGQLVFAEYTGTPYQATQAGSSGGLALNVSNGVGITPSIADSAITGQIVLGLRMFAEASTPTTIAGWAWVGFNLGLGKQARVFLQRTALGQYQITIRRADSFPGTFLYASPALGVVASWGYLEVKAEISTAGSPTFTVNYEGALVNSAASVGGQSAALGVNGFDRLEIGLVPGWYLDDMYLNDVSGSVNNDFLGPRRVYSHPLNGIGALSEFTAQGGAGTKAIAMQDELDSTKIVMTADNQRDLYSLAAAGALSALNAVRFDMRMQTETPGTKLMQSAARIGSTNYDLREHSIASAVPSARMAVMNAQPDGDPWTPSNLSDVQIGVRSGT